MYCGKFEKDLCVDGVSMMKGLFDLLCESAKVYLESLLIGDPWV